MRTHPKSMFTAANKSLCLLALSFALVGSNSLHAEVPERAQRALLSKAPQVDSNGDKTISMAELEAAFPQLPPRFQQAIRREIPGIGGTDAPETTGVETVGDVNCVLMGHSFFAPPAREIEAYAKLAGINDQEVEFVMSGSASGAPLSLWNNPENRSRIQALLDTGGVEMMGMTFFPHNLAKKGAGPEIEELVGYENWVNYAVEKNPGLERVFIAASWAPIEGGTAPLERRKERIESAIAKIHSHIDVLRERYPSVTFQCIPYGRGAFELEGYLAKGELEGIEHFQMPDRKSLGKSIYRDKTGHACPILAELSTLIWLRAIYGVDLVNDFAEFETNYDAALLKQIATDVVAAHDERYNAPIAKSVN
ncbi:MAG: hypothetical protein AAGA96_01550 [Verrucomicrobiota bacterium]